MDETDIYYWINCISKPHDEWTDDTARIAIELICREDILSYSERRTKDILGGKDHDN